MVRKALICELNPETNKRNKEYKELIAMMKYVKEMKHTFNCEHRNGLVKIHDSYGDGYAIVECGCYFVAKTRVLRCCWGKLMKLEGFNDTPAHLMNADDRRRFEWLMEWFDDFTSTNNLMGGFV